MLPAATEEGNTSAGRDAGAHLRTLREERERKRGEILVVVDSAEDSLERGEGRGVTQQSMRELADEVKRRGRARLDGEERTPR